MQWKGCPHAKKRIGLGSFRSLYTTLISFSSFTNFLLFRIIRTRNHPSSSLPVGQCLALMASAEVPVVLRVKRKRTEDPADALAITKIKRLDPSICEEDTSIFHFVGTVAEKNVSEKEVLAQIHRHRDHRSLAKNNPLSRLTISDRHDICREQKKASSSNQRFKLVSQLRHLENAEGEPSQAKENREQPIGELMNEMVHLYDVVQEEGEEQNGDATVPMDSTPSACDSQRLTSVHTLRSEHHASTKPSCESSTITCNSTRMLREKISQRDNGSSEYVYDIYYTQNCSNQEFDWTSLSVYEPDLVHDILDHDEGMYDDEDDSNDESNWRNDYPDEDGSGREGQSSCSDSEEELGHANATYRHREAYDDEYLLEDVPYHEESYWTPRADDSSGDEECY